MRKIVLSFVILGACSPAQPAVSLQQDNAQPTSVVEVDPIFSAAPAAGISAADLGKWNGAAAFGDHRAAGYLTSEADPLFTASSAATIGPSDIAAWNEAHSWGDHHAAGYLTAGSLSSGTVPHISGAQLVQGTLRDTGTGVVSAGAPQEVIDQTNPSLGSTTTSADMRQSFTAGKNGALTAVQLYLFEANGSTPIDPVSGTLEIYAGSDITGTLLHSQPLSGRGEGDTKFALTTPVQVSAGQVYTMRFVFPRPFFSLLGSYAGGVYSNGNTPTANDTQFATFVSLPTLETRDNRVSITSILHLTPRPQAPTNAQLGDLYVRTDGKLFFFNGLWREVSLVP